MVVEDNEVERAQFARAIVYHRLSPFGVTIIRSLTSTMFLYTGFPITGTTWTNPHRSEER